MSRSLVAVALALVMSACSQSQPAEPASSVRLLLVGDVMLGRGLSGLVEADPDGVFADVKYVVSSADLAFANLESPLTAEPHVASHDHDLAAPASVASLLTAAGFDAVSLANNHIGDSGPSGVIDTIAAVGAAGLTPIGAGGDRDSAFAPGVFDANGVMVAVLAFDCTGLGLAATDRSAGVAVWDDDEARAAVEAAAGNADVVVVSLHGGAPFAGRDRVIEELGRAAVDWGADIVWGHGAHVPLTVNALPTDGRAAILASGLGNFVFDQYLPDTQQGLVLEVMADESGVVAYRTGLAHHEDRRVRFDTWLPPDGDAVLLGLDWWSLTDGAAPFVAVPTDLGVWAGGDLIDASRGDIDGDGSEDLVVAFRRPHLETEVNRVRPDVEWVDRLGRSAHLGIYSNDGSEEVWVAGSLLRPVAAVAACDGSLAVAYNELNDDGVVASGGWRWDGFGFMAGPDLDGNARLSCIDVDGDGLTEPVLLGR